MEVKDTLKTIVSEANYLIAIMSNRQSELDDCKVEQVLTDEYVCRLETIVRVAEDKLKEVTK